MNTLASTPKETRPARSFEVQEFIRFKPEGGLVPVKHYCTVYHKNGRTSREAFPVEPLLREIIRGFNGKVCATDGALTGYFEQPELAWECAQAINAHHGKNAEVSGTELTVSL